MATILNTTGARILPGRLVLTWVVCASVLGALLVIAQHSYGGLDDPDQAQQRPGFLDARRLPRHPPTVGGVPAYGERGVVFFVRPAQLQTVRSAVEGNRSLPRLARLAIVSSSSVALEGITPVVGDPDGRLAVAYGMRRPRDGGPPVGYAVVDRAGRVRYATLDPDVGSGLKEVATIVRAEP